MGFRRLLFHFIITVLVALFAEKFIIRDLLLQYRNVELNIKGKTVLVTGASTGIGEQTAYRFAEQGARIVITARRLKTLEQVAAKCRSLGSPDVSVVPADMGIPDQVGKVSNHVIKHFRGKIDYVILNHIAGITYTFYDNDPERARFLMQVNYLSYVQLATALMPHLEETSGSLVVISSIAGRMRVPFAAAYSATKFALEGFFNSWRRELKMRKSPASISFLPFGLIGTENAKTATKDKVVGINYESPADAGLAVVRVAVTKPQDHFWPWWGRLVVLFSQLAPDTLEQSENLQYDLVKMAPEISAANKESIRLREENMKKLVSK